MKSSKRRNTFLQNVHIYKHNFEVCTVFISQKYLKTFESQKRKKNCIGNVILFLYLSVLG